jgi:hypothetical protein
MRMRVRTLPRTPWGKVHKINIKFAAGENRLDPPKQFEDVRPGPDPDKTEILELSVKPPTPENDDFMFGHLVLVFDESRAGEISLQVGFEKVKDVLNISPMNHFSRRFVAIPSSKPKQLHVTRYELLQCPKPHIFRGSRWAFI